MAIKTFTDNTQLPALDINTFLANSGLVYITQTSATSGPSLSIDNCFSSTYSNYRILIDGFVPSVASQNVSLRMRVGGADAIGAEYYWGLSGIYQDGTSTNSANAVQTSMQIGLFNSTNTLPLGTSTIDVFAPNRAERTHFNINSILYNTQFGARVGFGEHNATTAYTGFTLFAGAGNFTNVRVWVYGYRIS